MKFYRVAYSTNGGNSNGFTWHTSRARAEAAAKADHDLDPEEYNLHASRGAAIEHMIDVVEIEPTKKGIRDALMQYAAHPDNG